ncbi:MAG: hypothetical protein WCN95_11395 [bacterium]
MTTKLLGLGMMGIVVSAFVCSGCSEGDSTAVIDIPIVTNEIPHAVHSVGDATIMGTYEFDLDAGSGGTTVVPAGNTADVFWRRMTLTDSELRPVNGATIDIVGVVDFDNVTYEQVSGLSLGVSALNVGDLPAGTVVGFKTDGGRYGKMKVNSYAGNYDMSMSWLTWQ